VPPLKLACPSGHPYRPPNVLRDSAGKRRCRVCLRATARRCYQRTYEVPEERIARRAADVARREAATLLAAREPK
jgi:hypothetical protein